jgi:hypothetical protein
MRMWEILEKHDSYRPDREYGKDHEYGFRGSKMGMRSSDHDYKRMIDDAYECGFEEGFRKAMEEVEHHKFSERRMK